MYIDRAAILKAFEALGEYDRARDAETELPDQVDTDSDRHLFERFGIDPDDLLRSPRSPRET